MFRRVTGPVVLGCCATVLAFAAATPAAVAAAKTTKCGVGSGEGEGYTYLLKLAVTQTNCTTGKVLVKHHGKVAGWKCSSKKLSKSPVQYIAAETCTKAHAKVSYEFTENT